MLGFMAVVVTGECITVYKKMASCLYIEVSMIAFSHGVSQL